MLCRTALAARAFRAACRPQFVASQSPALTSVRRYAAPPEDPIKLEHDQHVEGYWKAKGYYKDVSAQSFDEFADPAKEDPEMTGGYVNPEPQKRIFRDPYAPWWDEQERRMYGEPVHEDNDILGVFSPEPYPHIPARKAFAGIGIFIAFISSIYVVCSFTYPDKPTVERRFPGGLDRELGGPGAVPALAE